MIGLRIAYWCTLAVSSVPHHLCSWPRSVAPAQPAGPRPHTAASPQAHFSPPPSPGE